MRNELNDIEKIERYLRNEMSVEEKVSFEKEMEQNPALKKSMEEQKELLKGIERMKMKKNISSAKFKYKFWKGAINIGIPVIVTVLLTTLILNFTNKKTADDDMRQSDSQSDSHTYELPQTNENGDSLWADADKYIPYQIYSIDANKDTVITGNDGMVVAIPANCFVDENGNAVKGKIDFELKEALTTETILRGGLSTYSNGELLETGGMFYINARQDGKSLKINEGKNIYADVPSDPNKTGMMLFDGERKPDGSINWINPKPIEKPLVPVDIHTLNFYPPLYEDSLAKMGKEVTNKKYKDSLYYSFAGRFGKDEWKSIDLNKISHIKTENLKDSIVTFDPDSNRNYLSSISKNNELKLVKQSLQNCDLINGEVTKCLSKIGYKVITNRTNFDDYHSFGISTYQKSDIIIFVYEINTRNGASIKTDENSYILNHENPNLDLIEIYKVGAYSKNCDVFRIGTFRIKNNGCNLEWNTQYQILVGNNVNKINHKFRESFPCFIDNNSESFSGLNPAKVKSIWNDKFQNTLIATKEFEERMPYIHKLCSRGNNVLDMYVKNVDKKMCIIDSMVANTLSGADKEQFLKFAARGEGKVKTEDNCLKKLGEFYDEQTKIYTEAARKTAEDYYLKNKKLNEESDKEKSQQKVNDAIRKNENFKKELDLNLDEAYRQLGKERPRNIDRGRPTRTAISSTGWKNVDRYVIESTTNRTTMNYTDPQTGKKAILKYEPLEIKIKNIENYDRVLVYLLPDQLNSFMRMNRNGNIFTEKLNTLFKHELVILAYKGDKSYFNYLNEVSPNENYEISLGELSESEINKQLANLKKMQHADEMKKDISHQFFLQADAKRRKVFLDKEKFIRRIEMVIFPCRNVYMEMPELDAEQPF